MRGVTLIEMRFGEPCPGPRCAGDGGLAVGTLALVTPGVLSSGHGALHRSLSWRSRPRALLILLLG